MDVNELEKQFKGSGLNPAEIAVFGGEPTLHPHFVDIYKTLDKLFPNACKSVVTNGYGKSAQKLEALSKYNPNVITCVSVDGDRETHNSHRGKDSYDSALQTLAVCRKNFNRPPRISFTITPDNIDCMPRIVEICKIFGSDISMRTATCGNYFNGEVEIKWTGKDITRLQRAIASVPEPLVCHPSFVYTIPQFLRDGKHFQCIAPFKSIAVDPNYGTRICHSREPICQLKDVSAHWYKDSKHKETFNGSCFDKSCYIDSMYSLAY